MLIYVIIALFALIFTPSLQAAHKQTISLPKVVVHGSALPSFNPLDSVNTFYIATQDLERRQAASLADALRHVPGAYVTQQGSIGQESRVSLRGTGNANTTVIVNGMPIYDASAFDGTANLSQWTVNNIDNIQIIRGPMGSLYGPSSMGGVVVIETKKGQGPPSTFARVEGGSFRTFSQMVGIQGTKGMGDYYVSGSRLQSAGTSSTPGRFLPDIRGKSANPFHQETYLPVSALGQSLAIFPCLAIT